MIIKNNYFLLFFLFSVCSYAQLSIGKTDVGPSVLLDFAEETTNGIVLPNVIDADTMENVSPGTLVFDKKSKMNKFFDGVNWQSLNQNEGIITNDNIGEEIADKQGVILGSDKSDAPGVLILESENKAMVLPKVSNPAKNIPSPSSGMMCLDTISNNVYFFNGLEWDIWGF